MDLNHAHGVGGLVRGLGRDVVVAQIATVDSHHDVLGDGLAGFDVVVHIGTSHFFSCAFQSALWTGLESQSKPVRAAF